MLDCGPVIIDRAANHSDRRLIHSVVVHAEPGAKGFDVEIKGRLQKLLNAPFLTRSVGGVSGPRHR